MNNNEFDNEFKYKLYRKVNEILHPTISKKNISNYKIILEEELMPIRVFYPIKVTNINKVIIFIHGSAKVTNCMNEYSNICKQISLNTGMLVIGLEYEELKHNYKDMYNNIYNIVKYLYNELLSNNIKEENISLMGDSTGCNIITGINYLNNNEIAIQKEILFYPTISLEYFGKTKYQSITSNASFNINLLSNLKTYYETISYKKDLKDKLLNPLKLDNYNNIPTTLIFTGNIDILKDEAHAYFEKLSPTKNNVIKDIPFAAHGFLKQIDKEIEEEVYTEINNFLS
jgi:acetyl esterase/lipase